MISVKQCLEALHRGDTVSMVVVSYDKRRPEKSGQLVTIPACQLMWGELKEPGKKPKSKGKQPALPEVERRNPQHAHHYTRNVRWVQGQMLTEIITKIHPPLIIEFNGQTVCP